MIPAPFKFRPFVDVFNHLFNVRRFHEGLFKDSFQKGLFANKGQDRTVLKIAEHLRDEFARSIQDFDFWLTPISPGAAIKHQKTGTPQTLGTQTYPYCIYLGNFLTATALFHHPILSAPIARLKSGLPIGVQLHGKHGEDWQLLSDASKLKTYFYHHGHLFFSAHLGKRFHVSSYSGSPHTRIKVEVANSMARTRPLKRL
ncbi:MAG: amidase family protein [Bdellovibrionales bacterium]